MLVFIVLVLMMIIGMCLIVVLWVIVWVVWKLFMLGRIMFISISCGIWLWISCRLFLVLFVFSILWLVWCSYWVNIVWLVGEFLIRMI